MKNFKKHHAEHLDGTRGSWRPALIGALVGADGHYVSWKEIVVVSCHNCGLQYGVGGDEAQIQPDGTTDIPVRCHHCGLTDHMTFDSHAAPAGREHFAKIKAEAEKGVRDARLNALHEKIKADMQADLHDRALAEARKILPDGATNAQELFKSAMGKKFTG
jgi:hypothetical protein